MSFLPISFNNVQLSGRSSTGLRSRSVELYPWEMSELADLRNELVSNHPSATISEPKLMTIASMWDVVMEICDHRPELTPSNDSRVAFVGVIVSLNGYRYAVNLNERWELETKTAE